MTTENEKLKEREQDAEWVDAKVRAVLRETPSSMIEMYDAEHPVKFEGYWRNKYANERAAWRRALEEKAAAEARKQAELRKAVEKEFAELYEENYFVYVRGKRLERVKDLTSAIRCECGGSSDANYTGIMRELYDRRHAAMTTGDTRGLPYKLTLEPTCSKCKGNVGLVEFVVIF